MRVGDVRENRGRLMVYLGVARPDHWFKNVLVLAGGTVVFLRPEVDVGPPLSGASRLAWALVVTCLASGANYIVNEILDGPRDKLHPVKRFRPVPANEVSTAWLWRVMKGNELCGAREEYGIKNGVTPTLSAPSNLDDCLAPANQRAWASPIFVDFKTTE